MKKLIMINGTAGVGKSVVCRELNKALGNSVWLDGDWCWMMDPFESNEENRKMVEDNITHMLRNFLTNSSFRHIVFDWVMDYENMFERILRELEGLEFELHKITLMCSEDCLRLRIRTDVENNLRSEDAIEKSVKRLSAYENMDTVKIDTTNFSIGKTVEEIIKLLDVLDK